jgi:formate-dependent phosphoribosylglycinamide formyltransferase (GAR transformylase)
MHVLFVEPSFPHNQKRFVHALAAVGARVTGIGERPADYLDGDLKGALHGYEQVGSVCDEGAMHQAVRRVQGREWVDRLEATVEAHILPVAKVREACTIPGTSVETAWLCRDKPAMKEALRKAGVPCALSTGASTLEEAREFAGRVGFPLVVKPRSSAGAAGTVRVDSAAELERALAEHRVGGGGSVALEEFIEGHEGFWDTLTVGGQVVHEFISHYYPRVLDAMRERWISPYLVTTNRLEAPTYVEVRRMGLGVLEALGIGTSATHMEWFFGPKGLKFSEIGCRPPGVSVWDLYSAANDLDLYHEWAAVVVHGRPTAQASRAYSAGMIALRPDRDGRIAGYAGIDEIQSSFGPWILDAHLPPPGTPTQPVEAGYMANAWVRMRHPDYDELRRMLETVGRTIKVFAR